MEPKFPFLISKINLKMIKTLERLAGLENQTINLQPTIDMISAVISFNVENQEEITPNITEFRHSDETMHHINDDILGLHISSGLVESIKSK